jgi:6-phosphogluconolactonase
MAYTVNYNLYIMKPEIHIFTEAEIMANSLAEEFYRYVNQVFQTRKNMHVALSGGNTPLLFFKELGLFNEQRKNKIDWNHILFFWGDERCVPADDPESNYGSAKEVLFDKINIPVSNVNPIFGEADPEQEMNRYSELLTMKVPIKNNIPVFDWVFLGVGDDGHTASIFPGQTELLNSDKICGMATHPESGQKRISLTARVINAARRVTFMATGEDKKDVVAQIINKGAASKKYPAARINPENGRLDWYLDSRAADEI